MISNYSQLKTAIANFMHRTDLDSNLPTFIQLAEKRITNIIKSGQLENLHTTYTVAAQETIDLPADYTALKSIVIKTIPQKQLTLRPAHIINQYNQMQVTGRPEFYCIELDKIKLSPIPDAAYQIDIVSFDRLDALSDTNTTNWVLEQYPYLYLYASLVEASIFTNDVELIELYQSKYNQAIEDIWKNYNDKSFSGGPLTATNDYIVDWY